MAALMASTVVPLERLTVRSTSDTSGTGTRSAMPWNLPLSSGRTRATALAAPVVVGMIACDAARARRRSLWGPSRTTWSLVNACTVVIKPVSMPKESLRTLATGARQLVVHEALERMLCLAGSYDFSLTPITTVRSSFLAGAEMMTLRAPAAMCALAFSASVNRPVDSTTMSTPRSPHGSLPGSRSASTLIFRPSTVRMSPSTDTVPGKGPRMVSYLSR